MRFLQQLRRFRLVFQPKAKLDFSKYDDVKLDFTDNDIIPQWAVPAVKAVYKEGIILGRVNDDGTSTFAPYDNITRAEAMTILGRILPNNDDLPNLPFADIAHRTTNIWITKKMHVPASSMLPITAPFTLYLVQREYNHHQTNNPHYAGSRKNNFDDHHQDAK